MVLVHDTSSECVLQMYEVSLKYLLWLWTRNSIANDQREQLQNIQSGVMVLVRDTLFHCALEVHEVSTKKL